MLDNVVYNFVDNGTTLLISPTLQYMRNDIIPILMHRQICYYSHYLVCDRSYLLSWEPLHYPLHYTTAILISTKLSYLICDEFNDCLGHI